MTSWHEVALGELLAPVARIETVEAGRDYPLLGARWYAKGLYIKETKSGAEIRARTLYRVQAGDFVYNRLFAWKGSFAIASEEHDGCFVSNEFPCFEADRDRLDPRFLRLYFSRQKAWSEAFGLSSGSTPTSRNRLKEEQFLRMRLPLPPLSEQQRIVALIEGLAAKVADARALSQQASAETSAIINSAMLRIFRPGPQREDVPLESVCFEIIDNLHSNPVYSDEGVACVRSPDVSWGKLRLATALKTSEEEYVRRTVRGEPRTDDIILVREGGGTGKAAIVEEGQRFSLGQRVMLLRPDSRRVVPRFFLHQLLSPAIYEEQILALLKGSASPHLNIGALRKFRFYLPSISEQHAVVTYLDKLQAKIDLLSGFQAETAAELDALLPSILDKAFKGEL
jgi:type I restriction enzyme S subunit